MTLDSTRKCGYTLAMMKTSETEMKQLFLAIYCEATFVSAGLADTAERREWFAVKGFLARKLRGGSEPRASRSSPGMRIGGVGR